jgi:hypothetical protein
VSFPVLKIWENVETRCAQTPTFSDPNFSALQARRPDWGAWALHALWRECWSFHLPSISRNASGGNAVHLISIDSLDSRIACV